MGEARYKHLPGVFKIFSDVELVELLQNANKLKTATEEEKIKAIYVLYKLSFEASRYPEVDLIADGNVAKFVKPFADKLGISPLNRSSY
jgi:hypothetical protein